MLGRVDVRERVYLELGADVVPSLEVEANSSVRQRHTEVLAWDVLGAGLILDRVVPVHWVAHTEATMLDTHVAEQ